MQLEFQLFRIQVYPPIQGQLFEPRKTPSEILKEVIYSLPSARLRRGMTWHVGNVTQLDEKALYFRLGRITQQTREVYHDGQFEEQAFEEAPYTHVLLDLELEVCAVARKIKLAVNTARIARQLARLLEKSTGNVKLQADFDIKEIYDPKDFLTHLRQARVISKFWVTFSRPNAFDVNKDFIKPMQKLLNESAGDEGKTELEGDNLNKDSLEELARSAASVGNDAGALLQPQEKRHRVRKSLKGNPATYVTEADIADEQQKKNMIQEIRDMYQRLRGGQQ